MCAPPFLPFIKHYPEFFTARIVWVIIWDTGWLILGDQGSVIMGGSRVGYYRGSRVGHHRRIQVRSP